MTNKESSSNTKTITTMGLWIIGVLVVTGLWYGSYHYFAVYRIDLEWVDKGSIGDSFGAINALFAGLAFVALLITIHLQSKALREAKADLDLQGFENKYFQLVRVHNDILDGIMKYRTVGNHPIAIHGRQRFVDLFQEFIQYYDAATQNNTKADPIASIQSAYNRLFKNNEHELGHYFRHLYNIVAFVDRSEFSFDIKRSYIKLLRAQLSSGETQLLFYNCLWDIGRRKFKPLVEKYALLEHLPELRYPDHKSLFEPSAFKEG